MSKPIDLVFAFDNNYYDGYAEVMTRAEFEAWQALCDGSSPVIVPPTMILQVVENGKDKYRICEVE